MSEGNSEMKGERVAGGQTRLTIALGCQHRPSKVAGKLDWHLS